MVFRSPPGRIVQSTVGLAPVYDKLNLPLRRIQETSDERNALHAEAVAFYARFFEAVGAAFFAALCRAAERLACAACSCSASNLANHSSRRLALANRSYSDSTNRSASASDLNLGTGFNFLAGAVFGLPLREHIAR